MKKLNPGKRLPFKRRMEMKTDYTARLKLLKSGLPRLVVRRGNDNIRVQIVRYEPSGDKTLLEEMSRNLRKLGWTGHCGNIPAAYLTGLLAGLKAARAGVSKVVLDTGLQSATKGNAVFAAAKGVRDAGIDVPVDETVLPDDKRVQGEHIAQFARELKGSDAYMRQFKTDAENTVKKFDDVKSKIKSMFENR